MERPILFNTEMVKAILKGRKTQTRRIIKDVNGLDFMGVGIEPKEIQNTAAFGHGSFDDVANIKIEKRVKAPCLPGDILWVRETWEEWTDGYVYKVGGSYPQSNIDKWKPSIHMPKEAARIFLKVTAVRAEKLNDMNEDEALKEGFISTSEENEDGTDYTGLYAIENFRSTWNSIYEKQGYGWKDNPWVWVIEFGIKEIK